MYIRKVTTVSDDMKLIQNYHPARYGAPGKRRKKKTKETPESVKEQNRKNRAEKLQLLILSNFYKQGHHVVLGYPRGEAPETYEEAERILTKFLARIQRHTKGQFRYIAATERGKRTAVLHHHMIIRDTPGLIELIEKEWPGKRIHSTATYEDDTCGRQLADYITKSIDKGDTQGHYHISRNLTKPTVTKELAFGRMKEPTPPKGYQIVPDTLYTGINPFNGWPYQRYIIRANIKKYGRLTEWNQGFSIIGNLKPLTEAAREAFGNMQKPAFQNGIGLFDHSENAKHSNNTGLRHTRKGQKPAFQNGIGLFGIVDRVKAFIGAGKKHIKKGKSP